MKLSVRIIPDDWNSGESGAEKPRGGDQLTKTITGETLRRGRGLDIRL